MKLFVAAMSVCTLLLGCASTGPRGEQELASVTAESIRKIPLEERLANSHEAWIQAVLLDLQGQPQLAMEMVQTAAFYDPDDRALNISLARRLRDFRRSTEALGVLRRALRQGGSESSTEWELAAGLWIEAGEKDSADIAWTRVLELDKHSREAILGKASLAEARGDLASAAHAFAALADEYGPQALPLIERAESHWLKLGKPDSVEAMLRHRWSEFKIPSEGEKLARFLGSFGKIEESIRIFDTLETLEPEDAQKYALYSARYLLASGRRQEALARFRLILKDDPSSSKARASIGAVLLDLDSTQAAEAMFRKVLESDSTSATAWYFLGLAAQRSKSVDSARVYLDRSIRLDPKAIETWIRRGMLELESDSLVLAAKVFSRMVDTWPNLAQARFLSGYCLSRLAHRNLVHPEREQNPSDSEPIANSFRKLAIAQMDTALRIDSLLQRARFERGSLLERTGNLKAALVDLRIAVHLDPTDLNTANYLGYLLADHGQNLDEADTLISTALAGDTANPAYLDSRAWLRFRQTRYPEALVDIEKALSGEHKDPTMRQHHARILEAMGFQSKALDIWKQLLKEDPADPVNQAARTRMRIQ